MEARIREGNMRSGYTMLYHELFDLYQDYVGDKALLYYLYLLRYRNTKKDGDMHGKSWNGRRGVVEKFQMSYSTLPLLDEILRISGLIDIETKPSGRGRDKIYYIVHDPKTREEFRMIEGRIKSELLAFIEREDKAKSIVGKAVKPKRKTNKTTN